jgi:hypothetical protein
MIRTSVCTTCHLYDLNLHQYYSQRSPYLHLALFLAIALSMQLDSNVLDRYFDTDLDSDRSNRDDHGAGDVDRRLQEEDEVDKEVDKSADPAGEMTRLILTSIRKNTSTTPMFSKNGFLNLLYVHYIREAFHRTNRVSSNHRRLR